MPATLNFLICGAQKSGTSALHYYLKDHPEIAIASLKELHIFDNENRNWNAEGIKEIDNDIAHHFKSRIKPGPSAKQHQQAYGGHQP